MPTIKSGTVRSSDAHSGETSLSKVAYQAAENSMARMLAGQAFRPYR